MDPANTASIIVALIAAGFAYASHRSTAKASVAATRLDAEKEAYQRARDFDMATIARQDKELEALRRDNDILARKYNDLVYQLIRIKRGLLPDIEEELNNEQRDRFEADVEQPGV